MDEHVGKHLQQGSPENIVSLKPQAPASGVVAGSVWNLTCTAKNSVRGSTAEG